MHKQFMIPLVQQCKDLFQACGSSMKELLVFPQAVHSDLILRNQASCYSAVASLLDQASSHRAGILARM